MNMDKDFAKTLDSIITMKFNKLFDAKIRDNNFVMSWVGTVAGVNSDNSLASVILPQSSTPLINKKNMTGKTLNIGDEVYLFSPHSSLSTALIVYKK